MATLQEFYLKSEATKKQIYKSDIVKANKGELLDTDLGNDLFNYLYSVIPNSAVNTALLQNVDWDSLVWEFINHEGFGVTVYNDVICTLCKGVIDPLNIPSKLNRKGAVNSVLFVALSV